MRASIIIPAYNAEATIGKTLQACLAQDFPDDDFETIVVDDGSTDRTKHVVGQYPVRYLYQDNAGRGAALNSGAQASSGEVLVFLDADCIVPPDLLAATVRACSSSPDVGIVGATYAPSTQLPLISNAINQEIRFRHVRMPDTSTHIGGFCTAMRRSVFDRAGGYDETFRRAQDNEMSYRVVEHGYGLLVLKDVRVIHNHERGLAEWLKNQYCQAYWRTRSYRRHRSMVRATGYTGLRDWLSLALAVGMLLLGPFVWLPIVPWIELGLLAALAGLHVPLAVFAVGDTGDWRHVVLIPMQIVRSFAWAAGALAGSLSALTARSMGVEDGETADA